MHKYKFKTRGTWTAQSKYCNGLLRVVRKLCYISLKTTEHNTILWHVCRSKSMYMIRHVRIYCYFQCTHIHFVQLYSGVLFLFSF